MSDEPENGRTERRLILCIVLFYVVILAAFSFSPTSEFAVNATLLK